MKSSQKKIYRSRKTKAEYVFNKYSGILKKSVLDVGADAMHLKPLVISSGAEYLGIGYGEGIDYKVNLENTPFEFDDHSFETVVCLDVLEHLENLHHVFDELCRISNKHVILSLPNPWSDFFSVLRKGNYSANESLKFYGLPLTPPVDRHRWFFSEKEAVRFVSGNAKKNGFSILRIDIHGKEKPMGGFGLKGILGRMFLKTVFRKDITELGLHHGTMWFVLKKNEDA